MTTIHFPEKGTVPEYRVVFYPMETGTLYGCDAPRHGFRTPPRASAVCLILLESELQENRIVVHQASYVCTECRDVMTDDMAKEGAIQG